MTVNVRPLQRDDAAPWRKLWHGYLAFYDTELPDKMYDLQFERLLSDNPHDFHGLIAEVDGKQIGLAHFVYHRHGWRTDDVCYLQDLYADPSVRGKGVGRALIEAVYAAADSAGAPSVYWMTQDFNHTARQLYDRIGVKTPFIKYARPA
ncbi:MAG: GNAT family N-acetyltransferase [Silicimonas sp.]|nr:GNAT family N-acetyltransferase [Silicimonas sp.]